MQIFVKSSYLKSFILLLCSAFLITLSGCRDDDEPMPQPQQPITNFSLFQASPNAPDMDVLVGSQRLMDQVFRYPTYTGYYNAPPGNYRFRFNPVGAANSYIDSTLTFAEDKVYSLFTVGKFPEIDLLVVEDEIELPEAGRASIRFINLTPDTDPVNLVTTGDNGTTLFSSVSFMEDTPFIELAGGVYSFQIRQANGGTVHVSLNNHDLVAGRVFTFLFRGMQNPPTGNNNMLSLQIIRNL